MDKSIHPLKRLLRYGRVYRTRFWAATACSVLNKIFDLAPPYLIGMAVDTVVARENSVIAAWGFPDVTAQLVILSLLTLVIWGMESLFEYAYGRLWRELAQTMQHDLRIDAYGHLQELELGFFESRSTGQLLSILNDDINQSERFLDTGANELLQFATTVLFVGGTFIALAPGVSWLAMLPIPFILWGSIVFQRWLAPRYADVREKASLVNARLANNLSGIATIKSFTAEGFERDRVAYDSDAYQQSNRRAIQLSAAFVPLIRFVILIGFTATLFLGGMAAANGALSVGTYGFMVFIIQRLLWPFTRLGQTMDMYQRAMASINRVLNLLDTPIAIRSGTRLLPEHSVRGELIFDQVTFAYAGRATALNNLSLQVPAGKTIGIVGTTGSGKSTLVKLLLRFYELQQGQIRLDGIDISDCDLRDLRRCIGWVSQDVFLFHGTVADNITYGTFGAGRAEIVQAAKSAEAHEFIMALPYGYDTLVGERGQQLSGGQRQRLAIARAVLKDPAVLILDEATSAVDNETEAAIQASLRQITQDRTTIAIAHRLSTIRHAHCIYVIEQGQIAESGTHAQLIQRDGVYAGLWRVQSGEVVGA
ncbi:ABC transporter ATP-binding protein [filamentous cyanobacterium LEGE 11480]|uniref:ABC transporter ATP-binding protein n=1 Tax=Romeriopsis navalis LEGE 11480 TaxID=2777977 RepID=A0A928VJU3_9CYAN|nr:ABC transporter ATP-binding protein [Romeriopsis navalis]MBE9029938.1 ABC transporter ATP-binding protein [Romeriopsis navalis LEGE 11480]